MPFQNSCDETFVLKIQSADRLQFYRKMHPENVISFGHKHLALGSRAAENVVWANVFLGKCLSGQSSFWANVPLGKCLLGKCLSGQMSFWANEFYSRLAIGSEIFGSLGVLNGPKREA
jgi:hypothetical protein